MSYRDAIVNTPLVAAYLTEHPGDIVGALDIFERMLERHEEAIAASEDSSRRIDPDLQSLRKELRELLARRLPAAGRLPEPPSEAVPPVVPPREEPGAADDGDADEVRVHVRAQMEPQVALNAISTVSVTISCESIQRAITLTDAEGQTEVVKTKPLLLELIARANVEVVGRDRVEVDIPTPPAPRSALFDLRATFPGSGEVWVLVRQQQVPLLTLVLKPHIVPAPTGSMSTTDLVADQGEVVPAAVPARPLRLLRIIEQRQGDKTIYRYDLEALDLQLLHAFASRPLEQDRDRYVRSLFRRIEDFWVSSDRDVEAFQEQLRAFGGELLDELVPVELQQILWDHRDRLGHIMVLSTEPFIPWELVHLKDPATRKLPAETRFLGQMGLVRWQWGSWPPDELFIRPGRARFVIPSYPDPRHQLVDTLAERRFLEQRLAATAVPPHQREVLQLLRDPKSFDLLHFAGHGLATANDIGDAQVLLEGRVEAGHYMPEPLRASLVAQNFEVPAQGSRPVVVLNACQVGRLGYQLASIGGFAAAFVGGGAGAFVSSLWSVGDTPARTFLQAFYEALVAGARMAEAVTLARTAARRSGDATWLAYTVYGHPEARLLHQLPRRATGRAI